MEHITIIIPMAKYKQIRLELGAHTVKDIGVKDNLFDSDPIHKELKVRSDKAYKELKTYEWKIRNK